jgi:two-component system, response regulator PhcR
MTATDCGNATILYVDDEPLACKYFARAVEAEYEVLTAPDAHAALALLDQPACAVEVLVTDYRMPGGSGGQLLRQVEERYPHIVRILVTAHANKEVLLDTVNNGEVFRILEKPLDLALLRGVLRLAAARARERSARRASLVAVEETLAFLAHELTTPLATIVNFARGIVRRSDAAGVLVAPRADMDAAAGALEARRQVLAEIGDAAALMNDNARYCLSVLGSFVDSVKRARAGAGRADVGHSAEQIIATLLEVYPLSAPQRAAIETEVREDFPVTDLPNCVALVLSSLLSNALRALHQQAAPQLRFTVLVEGHPQIRISDNGTGIEPAILRQVLLDPVTTHAESGGSGLGMLFCKRVMQSFGGNIELHSEQGRSTTVTLNFPAIKKEYA